VVHVELVACILMFCNMDFQSIDEPLLSTPDTVLGAVFLQRRHSQGNSEKSETPGPPLLAWMCISCSTFA
jgi:hypothetical protein